MSVDSISRRAFFGQAAAAPAAGLIEAAERPKRAWIIVALNWDYNDEFSYENGERPQTRLFYEKEQADSECRRLCEEFFAAETPFDFRADFQSYLPDRFSERDFDEESVTWDELRKGGFPDPYYVLELSGLEAQSP